MGVGKFEDNSYPFRLEHNKIFGHNDSTNVIVVQNLINTVKLKHYSHFNVVLKHR